MLIAGMSTRAVARECNINFSTISLREFGSTPQLASQLQTTCKAFSDVNFVNRVPNGGGGVIVWAGISFGQRTQLHFIDSNLNAQRYSDKILRPIVSA
jgi:hypothetical protein